MELFNYTIEELQEEIENRKKQKTIYVGFENIDLVKSRRNNSSFCFLSYPLNEWVIKDNLNKIKNLKSTGYKVILIMSKVFLQYNKILADYADDVITY